MVRVVVCRLSWLKIGSLYDFVYGKSEEKYNKLLAP